MAETEKIYIAGDHAGLALKNLVVEHLKKSYPKICVKDLGTNTDASVDYPDYAEKVAHKLFEDHVDPSTAKNKMHAKMGILICGSGQGINIKANRYPHIRSALCWTPEIAQLSRQHNNANVLAMGGRVLDHQLALKIVDSFLTTPFEGGRHEHRVNKLC